MPQTINSYMKYLVILFALLVFCMVWVKRDLPDGLETRQDQQIQHFGNR